MNKADKYFLETILEIRDQGDWDQDPRSKWNDSIPAFSKFVTQKVFDYRIDKGEFPITSLRHTAIKGAFYDIEAIYQKQTNVIEKMNSSIHGWWVDFITCSYKWLDGTKRRSIGQTYGHTVRRYDLVDKLLEGMEKNPFSRRHIINLWQEEQMLEDPKALVPCAFQTQWSIIEREDAFLGKVRFIDFTLNQRSQDYMMTSSINPFQYTMFAMMVAGHLSYTTGIKHIVRKFQHTVQNCHIYDRHMFAIDELLKKTPALKPMTLELNINKNFYDYRFEDFVIDIPWDLQVLSKKLELAV